MTVIGNELILDDNEGPRWHSSCNIPVNKSQTRHMSLRQRLNNFFLEHEKRAFRMAVLSLQDRDAALDALQDVMLKFVEKYARKPQEQWPPLFYRMLHHRIIDFHRHNQKQSGLFGWFSRQADHRDNAASGAVGNPLENVSGNPAWQPENAWAHAETARRIEQALRELPLRQRQAFLLRCWQGMSVAETAHVMGCGQGSVKTHLSRAMQHLRHSLKRFPGADQPPDRDRP